MGDRNSSITRVWPVFDALLHQDPTGRQWLARLLEMGSDAGPDQLSIIASAGILQEWVSQCMRELPGPIRKVLGNDRSVKIGLIRKAYEFDLPPSGDFLRWLLEHPERLRWPLASRARRDDRVFGAETQSKREALLDGDKMVQKEALAELERCGAKNSRRKWWAFEGFTSVDCLLETDSLVVLVEGKRTEPVSAATEWGPKRNQIVRNVEVARARAMEQNKDYAVIVCAEKSISIADQDWVDSLPHLGQDDIWEMRRHYLGSVLWPDIAATLCRPPIQLPDCIDQAIAICLQYRG